MKGYLIRDLELLSGIKAHTIRIWEKRFGIIAPARTSTNRRLYSDDDLKKIINISILDRHGIKISRIASLSGDEITRMVNEYELDETDRDSKVDSLVLKALAIDDLDFGASVDRVIGSMGFEDAFNTVVFPLLTRVGLYWQTGSLNPSQEHFVTGVIRNKIIAGIESLQPVDGQEKRKIVMYLPEKEMHELGLLFWYYLAKKRGFRVLYLGQLTPMESLLDACSKWDPDILVTGTQTTLSGIDALDNLDKLVTLFPGVTIIVAGKLAQEAGREINSRIRPAKTAAGFISLLEESAAG